jgi:hypothetical protein
VSVLVNEFEVVPGQRAEHPAGQQAQQPSQPQKVPEPEVERMIALRHERLKRLEAD